MVDLTNAHEDQIVEVNGEEGIRPQPEFILSTGESVTDVTRYPEVILRNKGSDSHDFKYQVECHAVKSDSFQSSVAPEHIKVFEEEEDALQYATTMLGSNIPTANKGIVNLVDITEIRV